MNINVGDLAVSPAFGTDETLFAGTYGSGVFRSTDRGASWLAVNNGLTNTSVGALALSPGFATDHTIFAGTGRGVFRSTDGGDSWQPVNQGMPPNLANNQIQSLVISPAFASDHTVFAVGVIRGVFRSTDAGDSWQELSVDLASKFVATLAISPNFASDRTLFAGSTSHSYFKDGAFHCCIGGGVFHSIDAGTSWQPVNQGLPTNVSVDMLVVSPSYATDRTLFVVSNGWTWIRSTDGGASWQEVNLGGKYVGSLGLSPTFASDHTAFAGIDGGVLRSTDAGTSWEPVNEGLTNAFSSALAFSPLFSTEGTLFAGTRGRGVFRSTAAATPTSTPTPTPGSATPTPTPSVTGTPSPTPSATATLPPISSIAGRVTVVNVLENSFVLLQPKEEREFTVRTGEHTEFIRLVFPFDICNPPGDATFTPAREPITIDDLQEGDQVFVRSSHPIRTGESIESPLEVQVLPSGCTPAEPLFYPARDVQLNAGGIVAAWVTGAAIDGEVRWALNSADLTASPNVATDKREFAIRANFHTHRVAVTGIPGGSTIHYNIVSGGVTDPNGPYQATIPSVPLNAAPVGITGGVAYEDGTPGRECLVFIQVEQLFFGQTLRSLPISTMTDGGGYAADIKNIRLEGQFDQPLIFDANSADATLFVKALCDPKNSGTISRTTADADKLIVGTTVSEYQNMDLVVREEMIVPVPVLAGLNLVGVPVNLPAPMTAADLAQQFREQGGQAAQVVRWDPDSQGYVLWSASSPEANDFDLREGRGYFVLVVTPPGGQVWTAEGLPFIQSVPIGLVAGLNLVGVPFQTPAQGYDTVTLAQAVQDQGGQVAQIIQWDVGSQRFLLWSAASPEANVFGVDSTSGYFLLATQPTSALFEP